MKSAWPEKAAPPMPVLSSTTPGTNLELAKLILAESAETKQPNDGNDPAESKDEANAKDDPFSPENAAHPPEAKEGQKENPQKPSDSAANTKSGKRKRFRAIASECKRGGCPKCKKPGKKPGPKSQGGKGDGPQPNPGKSDGGTARPARPRRRTDRSTPDAAAGKKGKPGPGGKPNPNQKNAVGDAKEPGTGPADESKKNKSSGGKMVGPDGVTYERQDKPSGGTKGTGGKGSSEEANTGKTPAAAGEGAPNGGAERGRQAARSERISPPTQAELEKLFPIRQQSAE